MPETWENWLGLVNSCIYYPRQTREKDQALPYSVDSKAPGEHWNPLSKTVPCKCSFIWNKGPVNFLNDRKTEEKLIRRTCEYFPNVRHWRTGFNHKILLSLEVASLGNRIALKFGRCIGNGAAEVPGKFQWGRMNLITHLRVRDFTRSYDNTSYLILKRPPDYRHELATLSWRPSYNLLWHTGTEELRLPVSNDMLS